MPDPVVGTTQAILTPMGGDTAGYTALVPATVDRGIQLMSVGAYVVSPNIPRTSGGMGFSLYHNEAGNNLVLWELRTSTDLPVVRYFQLTSSLGVIQYWNGSAWVDVTAALTGTYNKRVSLRIDYAGCGTANGSLIVRCFISDGESEVFAVDASALDFSATPNIAYAAFLRPAGGTWIVSAFFSQDATAQAAYAYSQAANAEGTDLGGTGGFASIRTTTNGLFDTTFISLPAAADRRSVKMSAARSYGGRTVAAVVLPMRLRCGATGPQQAKAYLKIGGVRYYGPTWTLTTAFASYQAVWQLNPATGVAWTAAEAEAVALEYGLEAV